MILPMVAAAGLHANLGEAAITGTFFLSLAITFGLLALVPGEGDAGRMMRWPTIPAAVLALSSALWWAGAAAAPDYLWPAALVAGGPYPILCATSSDGRPEPGA